MTAYVTLPNYVAIGSDSANTGIGILIVALAYFSVCEYTLKIVVVGITHASYGQSGTQTYRASEFRELFHLSVRYGRFVLLPNFIDEKRHFLTAFFGKCCIDILYY